MITMDDDIEDLNLELTTTKVTKAKMKKYRYKPLIADTETESQIEDSNLEFCSKKENILTKALYTYTIVITLISFFLIFALAYTTNSGTQKTCESQSCIETANYILSKMNLTVSPCDNMYDYACGKWIHENPTPPEYSSYGSFRIISNENKEFIKKSLESDGFALKGKNSSAIKKLKEYYNTCMDETTINKQGTKDLLQLITKLGSWTISKRGINSWSSDFWNFQKYLTESHNIGRSSFFSFSVSTDDKNSSRHILKFGQNGLTLNYPNQYTEKDNKKYKDAFVKLGTDIAKLLDPEISYNETKSKLEKVYDLEANLSKIFLPRENMTDPIFLYNKMTLIEFQTLVGDWIDIKKYLRDSFGGRQFKDSTEIVVPTKDYFKQLGDIIKVTDNEVKANYIVFNMVQSFLGYLSSDFTQVALEFNKVLSGVSTLQARWIRCQDKTSGALGFAASALYVDKKFPPSSKKQVEQILDDVQKEFIKNLDDLDWMDDVTRSIVKDKADHMTTMVGYPDWILDPQELDTYYENLEVVDGQYFNNKLSAVKFYINRALNKYDKKPDPLEWDMYPHQVNAYYATTYNYVVLPAGILQAPFYAPNFPDAFLFGTLGMIVGHEMTHGFDSQGRFYDKHGNMADLWQPKTAKAFKQKSSCMIHEYDKFAVNGIHVKGKLTLAENIADNGGLKFAYRAFKTFQKRNKNRNANVLPGLELSEDQMLFLGFSQIWCENFKDQIIPALFETDPHSLARFRVEGSAMNSDVFSKAFQCTPKSAMNPIDKCTVW